MTDLYTMTIFSSIIIAFVIGMCLNKVFYKGCLITERKLFLAVGLTFLGIHLITTLPGVLLMKFWIVANIIGMWILYYYQEVIKLELFFKNNSKLLKSKKRKDLLISSIILYLLTDFFLNYYIVYRSVSVSTIFKFSTIIAIFILFFIEITNIFSLLTLLDIYNLPKVTIWGENLTKYEGWVIDETKDCFVLKEKFSGKIIMIKKEMINQIVTINKGF